MLRITALVILLIVFQTGSTQSCIERKYPLPNLSDSIRSWHLKNLEAAFNMYKKDSFNAENIIWYGRRLAYLGGYREAIEVFSRGAEIFNNDARFLRHRGHRYITLRCFDLASIDLKKAVMLIEGKEDEIEPDGIPNSLNIPTSTLHTNTLYHLGLTLYLQGNYRDALFAFEKALKISDNNDMYVATLNWLYITLRKLGRKKDANNYLETIQREMNLIENKDYLEILLAYKNNDESILVNKTQNQETLSNATLGFGLGNYYLLKGDKANAREIFQKVINGNQWSSFGYIAAEATLKMM